MIIDTIGRRHVSHSLTAQHIMLARLILLFVLVPLVELFILLRVATVIDAWPTFGIVIATGILGGFMAKTQGIRTLRSFQESLAEGKSPADSLIDGTLILCAGLLLLTPGLITDAIGFTLLIPWSRAGVREFIKRRFKANLNVVIGGMGEMPEMDGGMGMDDDVVVGKVHEPEEEIRNPNSEFRNKSETRNLNDPND